MSKAMIGRLILEASTGMHGGEARILSDAWADMAQQREELLDALKGMCALYNTDEGTRSLPQYVAAVRAISKAEAD